MGLIIKDKIQMLMKGYPTVSDKYNVKGGMLTGSTNVAFGEAVKKTNTTGYYESAASGLSALSNFAGIALATNVKVTEGFGDNTVVVKPGEAFNLLLDGYVAIELDDTAVDASVVEGAQVAILLATGKFTTSGVEGATDIPGYAFTGIKETVGGKKLAEIRIK